MSATPSETLGEGGTPAAPADNVESAHPSSAVNDNVTEFDYAAIDADLGWVESDEPPAPTPEDRFRFREAVTLLKSVLSLVEREADHRRRPTVQQVMFTHLALDFVLRRPYLAGFTIRDCAKWCDVSTTAFFRRVERFAELTGIPLERAKSDRARANISRAHRREHRSVLTVQPIARDMEAAA